MPFKTVLIDDEYWTLDLIRHIFPWDDYGFAIDASFTDALQALEYLVSHPVDLMVTDIRMPGLSGLDLLREYRRAGGDAECVIISGYGEFEYARAALQEGAFDYCLKPLKRQEAESVLARARTACLRRRETRTRAVMELLEESDGCRRAFEAQGVPLTAPMLLAMVTTEGAFDPARLEAIAGQLQHISIPGGRDKWVYLFGGEAQALDRLGAAIEAMARENPGPRVGLGRPTPVDQATPAWLHEADMAAHCAFVDARRRFERFDPRVAPEIGAAARAFSLAVGSRDIQLAKQSAQEASALLVRAGLGLYHAQNLYNRMVTIAQNLLGESAALEVRSYDELVESYASAEQMFMELAQNVAQLMARSEEAPPEGDSFRQLLEYVRENYAQKLSIKMLADRFYMNPTYLCELFRRKTGHTFNEYVTSLRMQRAAERIREGVDSLQEIADQVGYNDYFYFSKAFKKYYALSPSEYARKSRELAP